MPRRFGSKGQEVVGGSRKLYSGELHSFKSSSNIISIIKTENAF
jgi:hypothetical protein